MRGIEAQSRVAGTDCKSALSGIAPQQLEYKATDELLTTSPVIMGNFDLKGLAKSAKIANGKNISISGYWSKDKEGKIRITNANLGEMVYFHLITQGIKDEIKIVLQLQDNDDGILINPPDRKFLQKNKKNTLSEDVVNKTVYISKDRAVTRLYLSELWADMIEDDNGAEIELEWMAFSNSFEKKVKSEVLNVGFSKKYLFLKPAYENYSLPELLSKDGDTIIFSISDFAKEEVINQLVEPAGELAKKYRYNLATRVLKSGKKATNIGQVYERKKAIYTYNVFTNEGKEVTLKQASNFGFKNKYVNNGKLVTTKGISQIDYFANIGLKNNVLKAATEITQIWDIFDLAKVLFQDDLSELPVGYLGNPVSFAYALLNEAVIKPAAQGIIDDIKKGLEEDFEIIYKPNGLEACKYFVENNNNYLDSKIRYVDIFTPTLQKLLKNEFLSLTELDKYNKSIQKSEFIKAGNKFITHTIFYKEEKNKYGLNDDVFVNCIFINDTFLKK